MTSLNQSWKASSESFDGQCDIGSEYHEYFHGQDHSDDLQMGRGTTMVVRKSQVVFTVFTASRNVSVIVKVLFSSDCAEAHGNYRSIYVQSTRQPQR